MFDMLKAIAMAKIADLFSLQHILIPTDKLTFSDVITRIKNKVCHYNQFLVNWLHLDDHHVCKIASDLNEIAHSLATSFAL